MALVLLFLTEIMALTYLKVYYSFIYFFASPKK